MTEGDLPKLGRPKMYTEEEIEALGKDLVETMDHEDCWHLIYWATKHWQTKDWITNLKNQYPTFSRYLSIARQKLGAKYARQAMTDRANPWMIRRYMPHWADDKEWIRQDMAAEAKIEAEAKMEAAGKHLQDQDEKAQRLIDAADKITLKGDA